MARAAASGVATLLAAGIVAAALATSAGAGPLTVAAYYYPWYGPAGMHWDIGFARGQLAAPQLPALGEYDSRDPNVVATHFDWAHQYGVDVFLCSWWGPGSYEDETIQHDLLPSPARGPTQIGLLYESIQRLGVGADGKISIDDAAIQTLTSDFAYLAQTAFRDPGYYRIAGRPVVVLYVTRIWTGRVAEAIQAIRAQVESIDGVDPYLIGDEIDWDTTPDVDRIRLYDAITGYTLYSPSQTPGWPDETSYVAGLAWRLRQYKRDARAVGIPLVPDALPGYDDRGVRPEEDHHVLPQALDESAVDPEGTFGALLGLAGSFVDPTTRLLTVTSWNEWHEDTQLEPTAPGDMDSVEPQALTQGYPEQAYGFGRLERLAAFKARWDATYRAKAAAEARRRATAEKKARRGA
jgi:hypothetical protein